MEEHSIQSNLFFNFWEVVSTTSFFLYISIGGRGIGKTFSILKGFTEENKKFIYMRRNETELKVCCNEENNPFKSINRECNRDISVVPNGAEGYLVIEDDKTLGIAGALSTFGKFRGADFSDVEYIFFDEFISTEVIDRLKKVEAFYFFNMIETVQRNRELLGKEPIKIILCANSNKLDSGILKELRLADTVRLMDECKNKEKKTQIYTDEERSIYINLPYQKELAEKKAETALYKLTKGTDFFDMAINNSFINDSFDDIRKIPNNQLVPIVSYEKIYFYEIKGKNLLYASYRKTECPHYYKDSQKAFIREYYHFIKVFIDGKKMFYSDYNIKLDVLSIA